ncbi:SigE family RNA polymerase sigma factor [Thermomonospora umbrina]|uniref:SigE family RNA polymerase sigma factor n=1 Tax=Thermomonospora umbrina TaxID=111806 RepID=UPI000E221205|nr:SigE family RNA polymerase sigma factor [Thermomonospora umbrina]
MSSDDEYTAYVMSRLLWLRRVAYLLCQDWSRADDLVQTAITRLYVNWRRASRADNLDAYARTVLVRVFLSEQRTGWWKRVSVTSTTPETFIDVVDLDVALDLEQALAALAPRQRATVVLRYYCDLSVEDTATALGCSPGTVKSQTSRALTALRRTLEFEGNPL